MYMYDDIILSTIASGERFARMLPALAALEYDNTTHEFRHTTASTQRTAESASAFAEGFLGDAMTSPVQLTTVDPDDDWLLYYYNLCEKYVDVRSLCPLERHFSCSYVHALMFANSF